MKLFKNRKVVFAVILVAVLLVVTGWLIFSRNFTLPSSQTSKPKSASAEQNTESSLQLVVISAPVYVTIPQAKGEAEVSESIEVKAGTVISTGETGRAELRYPNKSVTRLNFNTRLEVKEIKDNPQKSLLELLQGSIWNRVVKLLGNESFQTTTGSMVATVRGTAYRMGILEDGTNVLIVKEGTVAVDAPEMEEELVVENTRVTFKPGEDEQPVKEEYYEDSDDWTEFNLEQDKKWINQHKKEFGEDILGESTQSTEEESNEPQIPTPVLSNCTGPDGITFRATETDCNNLNNFWNSINPRKVTSSNNTSSGSTVTPVPATVTFTITTTPAPTTTPIVTPTVIITPTLEPDSFSIYVQCVRLQPEGGLVAYFNYDVRGAPINLFINRIEGGEGAPPATLFPGNRELVEAFGKQGTPITWIADNFKVTAMDTSPVCPVEATRTVTPPAQSTAQ